MLHIERAVGWCRYTIHYTFRLAAVATDIPRPIWAAHPGPATPSPVCLPSGLCLLLESFVEDPECLAAVPCPGLQLGPLMVEVGAVVCNMLVFKCLERVPGIVFTLHPVESKPCLLGQSGGVPLSRVLT